MNPTMSNVENTIQADAKTIRELLDKVKYNIDVFQREYTWEEEHVIKLLDDLQSKFFSVYDELDERRDVQKYPQYYLGSIIINIKDGKRSIIDGQQRLTTITLLLLYLHNLQKESNEKVDVKDLIFSEKFAHKSYNLDIPDRTECMDALYNNKTLTNSNDESVENILDRYEDIQEHFPEELEGRALPYFIDWLIEKVMLVEIKPQHDDDAYEIFETTNDRGQDLTSIDMLKGYLLSNLDTDSDKKRLNELWRKRIVELNDIYDDDDESDEFFKAWLRAKYAITIRSGKKGSKNEDFEKIDSRFHSWVRDNKDKVGLNGANSFHDFINIQFDFFSKLYTQILNATAELDDALKHVYYINQFSFSPTYYFPFIMSTIKIDDDEKTIQKKMSLVSRFLETFAVYRFVNSRTLSYSSIQYTMFSLIKVVRDKSVQELAEIFKSKINAFEESLDGLMKLELHQQNKARVQFLLARITSHIESKCGMPNKFEDYAQRYASKPFEIEHVWANKFEEHRDEFDQKDEFEDFRNRIGGLILIPKGFNQSYGDMPYEEKLPQYFGQNLLAQTLNPQCYENNPTFINYVNESRLPFKPHEQFKKSDLLERQKLYQKICEEIWSLDGFDDIVNGD